MADFFDEEYEKMQKDAEKVEAEKRKNAVNDWYTYGGGTSAKTETSGKKPLYIVLICVALVLAMILGWVLCAVFGGNGTLQTQKEQVKYVRAVVEKLRSQGIAISDEQLNAALESGSSQVSSGQIEQEALISEVFDYLYNNYYKDIDSTTWQAAVEAAGTALLQAAGDQFCHLMAPQTYYNYMNQVSNVGSASSNGKYFGIMYTYSAGLGLVVTDVSADSSCYGLVFTGDIVLKITDIEYNARTLVQYRFQGYDLEQYSEIVVSQFDQETLTIYMSAIDAANFSLLRNGDVVSTGVIQRGGIGMESDYDFHFVEFYFNENYTNISTSNQNFAQHNTYELRGLNKLPAGTGYIHLTEFMYYENSSGKQVTATDEFKQAMELFHSLGLNRLVLDLKGNPGGSVQIVCDIAGMLVSKAKLSATQQNAVSGSSLSGGDSLSITTLTPKNGRSQTFYRTSSYNNYFQTPSNVCDIVVWTDGGSASASELLTGALKDYGTGFQIGTKTYGKGIAQTITELPYTGKVRTKNGGIATEHWAIYYTFAAYYSPLGTNIHGKGYTPNNGYNNITNYVSADGSTTLWDATYRYWGITQ